MRAITVRQPYAWAIINGGKDIENRPRNLVGDYRGPVLIHAGLAPFQPENLAAQKHREAHGSETDTVIRYGAIIGVVDLVAVHHDSDHGRNTADRCSPWALPDTWHLVLANPRPLSTPIPARGFLHFWTPTVAAIAQIEEQLR